jgi:hypothetical protein
VTPEELLAEHTARVRDLALQLRGMISDEVPELTERVYPGWHGIGFRHPDAGYVCAIFPKAETVKLSFEHGADLVDPDEFLEFGSRKQVGYVMLRPGRALPRRQIRELLAAAIDDGVRRRR